MRNATLITGLLSLTALVAAGRGGVQRRDVLHYTCSDSADGSGTDECINYMHIGDPASGVTGVNCNGGYCRIKSCMDGWDNKDYGCVGPSNDLQDSPENRCGDGNASATNTGCVCTRGTNDDGSCKGEETTDSCPAGEFCQGDD